MKWLFTILFFITPLTLIFAQEFNAGFVQGLWYSDQEVFVDTPTRIYVAVRNNTDADLTGTVEFFVDGARIERNNVSALSGRIIESWADWKPDYGEHTISASLSRIELHQVGSSTEAVTITASLAEDIIFVDYDTDRDGIGNKEDSDDDGDGHSDKKEKEHGSDPLDPTDPLPQEDEKDNKVDVRKEDDDTAINRDANTENSSRSSGPEGLEQYLTDSRADRVLASMTDTINTTRERLDTYRAERSGDGSDTEERSGTDSSSISSSTESSSDIIVDTTSTNEDGFGGIERSQEKKGGNFFNNLIELVKRATLGAYTFVLYATSLYLSHPILVQITLLILILFILFKIAKRLGGRPS